MDSTTTEGPQLPGPPPLTSDVDSPDASPKAENINHSPAPSPDKNTVEKTQGYQCKLCTLVAPSHSALEEHMNIHTGSRPLHCLECGFSCSLQITLNQHWATHHQKDVNHVSAIETPSYENNVERLKDQTLTESAPTAATTTMQNDNQASSGNVTSPVTTAAPPLQQLPSLPAVVPSFHEHSKVFQCKLCTHISPTKTHLNEHMNVHSGKKPYKCLVCGFSSAFRSSLMRHLIVHTGTSKQYKCESCHYQTPYKCNLQAHKRKRHSISGEIDLAGSYPPVSHNATSPINSTPSLLQIQDPSKLMAHIGENNLDIRNRYSLPADALNSFLSSSTLHDNHSGNRHQPPSPNGSNTSASNDAQELFIHKNSNSGSETGDHPPILEKNHHMSSNESSSDHKDVLDYSGSTMINNDLPSVTASASPTAPILTAALPSGPIGTMPVGSLPNATQPPGEISVITPLQWASAGFPIYRRKKEGGARKRKRTPLPKRDFIISPTGEDLSDPWADTSRDPSQNHGENPSDVYRNVARDYAIKAEQGALNGGMDLSRESSYADPDGLGNSVSPSSGEQMKDDGMHSPGSGIGIGGLSQGSLLTRSTQTDPSKHPESQSQTASPSDLTSQLNKCPHCETYFADHVIFTLHMSCHGTRHPYQCSICGYFCRDKIEFTCHITRSQHLR